jgi:hypothetical protein
LYPGPLPESAGQVTGLEILNKVALGQTLFHRGHDAWDLLDADALVAAVLCPRMHHGRSRPRGTESAQRRLAEGHASSFNLTGRAPSQGPSRQVPTGS